MVPDFEKPRVTEIQVRIDCNGCVQKIKKALHGINGIYDIYINPQQQKLTVIGWADPEKIIKAIKKTRKLATICSHTEVGEPQPPNPPPPPEGQPPEPGNPPPTEAPPADQEAPPAEAPKEQPTPPENPPQEAAPPQPTPAPNAAAPAQPSSVGPSEPKDVEEIHHVIHHHPHQYGYIHDQWNSTNYPTGYGIRPEGPPHYINTSHSYNNYRPSPHISASRVMEYGYPRFPPQNVRYELGRSEQYYGGGDDYDYQSRSSVHGNGNNITSIFSDENPNACRIV